MSGQKENLTPLVLTGWVVILAVSSIGTAVKYKDVRDTRVQVMHLKEELDAKKLELDEWEQDLIAREGTFRRDFDVSARGSDAIPPPEEEPGRSPRKVEIPPK